MRGTKEQTQKMKNPTSQPHFWGSEEVQMMLEQSKLPKGTSVIPTKSTC